MNELFADVIAFVSVIQWLEVISSQRIDYDPLHDFNPKKI